MKPFVPILLASPWLLSAAAVSAECTAPEGANSTYCQSCGNLEQNVSRGHDLAWNKLLGDEQMRLELRVFGSTTVYLTDPPHASPGVLYYTVVIEDPQFTVTDTQTYAEALTLMHQYGIEFDYDGASIQAEMMWRSYTSRRIEELASMSISTGSAPYVMRLFDSRGNAIPGGTIEQPRQTPQQQLALAGPSDLNPDDRYRNEACKPDDPRIPDKAPDSDGGGSGGGGANGRDDYDYYDPREDFWWEWEEAWGGKVPHCVGDFSDPYGSGVICY